jgi:PD-(D/E)XK endonuclease
MVSKMLYCNYRVRKSGVADGRAFFMCGDILKSSGKNIRKPKERGEWAELRFMATAAELGFKTAKPFGDSGPYDVAIDIGERLIRVQVKSTMRRAPKQTPHHRTGAFIASMRHSSAQRYRQSEFDYLAVYVIPRDIWYIIPAAVATPKFNIRVWPGNPANQFERYRDAWHLLRESTASPARPPARRLTSRSAEA